MRGTWKWAGLVGAFLAGSAGYAYVFSLSNWRTTSPEVIHRILAPVLPTSKHDPMACARFKALSETLLKLRANSGEFRGARKVASDEEIAEVESRLSAGSVEWTTPRSDDDLAPIYLLRTSVKRFCYDAETEERNGRVDRSVRLLSVAIRLIDLSSRFSTCLLEQQSLVTQDAILVASIRRLVTRYQARHLRQVLSLLPPERGANVSLEQSIRGEVARLFVPLLPDVNAKVGSDHLGEFIGQLRGSISPVRNEKVGDYDPVATALLVQSLASSAIANARRPRTESDDEASNFIRALERNLPRDLFRNDDEDMTTFERWRYRFAMRTRPNAFGELVVLGLWTRPSQFTFSAFRLRTEREFARALLALAIFEQEKGRLPRQWSELATAGITKDLPYDHLGDRMLGYDPKRRLMWSVGRDALDDHGSCVTYENSSSQDWVWRIPIPASKG